MEKSIRSISGYARINGVVPGIKGQRAFPTAELPGLDPFVMLDHIGPQKMQPDYYVNGAAHPHRGFETITFMFEGIMKHVDSLGNKVTLESGSVQRMNAGSGIQHGGDMAVDPETQIFHEVQLWVNLPGSEKMSAPNIQNVTTDNIPTLNYSGANIRVIAGELEGVKGPIDTTVPIVALHILANKMSVVTIPAVPKDFNTVLYVMQGNAEVAGQQIDENQTVKFTKEGSKVRMAIAEGSQLLLLAGEPINEPVVMGGPFVMNTREEIEQAFADFESGTFGEIKD